MTAGPPGADGMPVKPLDLVARVFFVATLGSLNRVNRRQIAVCISLWSLGHSASLASLRRNRYRRAPFAFHVGEMLQARKITFPVFTRSSAPQDEVHVDAADLYRIEDLKEHARCTNRGTPYAIRPETRRQASCRRHETRVPRR